VSRAQRIVVFGLTLSSSWGNGHASTYRALLKALAARGHSILFLERERPWYAEHRDLVAPDYCRLVFYSGLRELEGWCAEIAAADAVIVGSYVPEGVPLARWVQQNARGVTVFYDIDTPVTLAKLAAGDYEFLSQELIPSFDLYLSFTGGPTLARLEQEYGSRAARAFYCCVDPELYRPAAIEPRYDLGYLGTYSADRQPALDRLLIEVARRAPERRFIVAGPQYPTGICWPANVERVEHLAPGQHSAFYSSQRWTLNVTRADMRASGHSPSVRLFEAAACGCPIVSDRWPGLSELFTPASEIVLADSAEDVLRALHMPEQERRRLAIAARARVLEAHTATHRAAELEMQLREAARARNGTSPLLTSEPRRAPEALAKRAGSCITSSAYHGSQGF
jgi:spore maturation protein CgeB